MSWWEVNQGRGDGFGAGDVGGSHRLRYTSGLPLRTRRLTCVTVALNHTIVWCTDKQRSAAFLTEILGLPDPKPFYGFMVVEVAHGLSLDYQTRSAPIAGQHYAFLVGEDEFDEIFGRINAAGLEYWADPGQRRPGEINHDDGGRGVYFPDPDGHLLEVLTRPYGSGS
jgi:catechol 2,3-dioxygenase-like lactoylglutathione lyase family enzyme